VNLAAAWSGIVRLAKLLCASASCGKSCAARAKASWTFALHPKGDTQYFPDQFKIPMLDKQLARSCFRFFETSGIDQRNSFRRK
jgi:hypothetical protein